MKRDYNKEAHDSDRKYAYDFDNLLRHYMMDTFIQHVRSANGRVLEMGCYKGEFTEILCQHFDNITVIEAADELVEFTSQRVDKKVKFICSTFEEYNSNQKYDYIFLMHTLEHLDHPKDILRKIGEWLSDNGVLYLVCPNANAPSRQIAVKMGLIEHNAAITESERIHGHRKTYSLDTLEAETKQTGLEVVHRGGIFFKGLANYQFDKIMNTDIISKEYLDGCYKLGMVYPDLCASIYLICQKEKQPVDNGR
jgi:2-polyprenyl-3-methyl-5-hydroxy-6-metoxy-1,4-benzoquinol methylase